MPRFTREEEDDVEGWHWMYLKGDQGAVAFMNFILPAGLAIRRRQHGTLGYHSFKPIREYHTSKPSMDSCSILDGRPCWSGDTYVGADPFIKALNQSGKEAVWTMLEHYYSVVFEKGDGNG